MLLNDLVTASEAVAATRSRLRKTAVLADLLRRLPADEIGIAVAWLSGSLPQGRIGLGPALLRPLDAAAAPGARLSLTDVDRRLGDIAGMRGAGSQARRRDALGALFVQLALPEQRFMLRLLLGELRQGALVGLMTDVVAQAADLPVAAVRRALMLSGDLPLVARRALVDGAAGLAGFRFALFRPLQPMLAQPAPDTAAALRQLPTAILEYKLDGARVQLHKSGDEVRVFTRQLNEVTASVPELVEAARALPADSLVLDGEAIALDAAGRPRPFQVTMQRFGRRSEVAATRARIPLTAAWFDCLHVDGQDLLDLPTAARQAALDERLAPATVVPRRVCARPADADAFVAAALAAGHEGVMAKSPDALYQAGSRGADWLKIKPAHTLDLVVLAAEWGSGRRQGWLSNLHLGARDAEHGGYVMLGKTFKGLTDEMLAWQTDRLLALELGREGQVVHVRPELVVEIAFNELQRSHQYPGGMALRFARVKRYRADKSAAEADTLAAVRGIYRARFDAAEA